LGGRGITTYDIGGFTSSSRMRVINHNWSATKQRPHPQSIAVVVLLMTYE